MSGSALFHMAFIAVVVMILLTVWAAMVLEAGARPTGSSRPSRPRTGRDMSPCGP
jgi:hypothetical protein